MDISNEDYSRLVDSMAQPSPIWKDLLWAFCVGGGICTVGQALLGLYQSWGLDKDAAGTAVSVTLIAAAALLTGLGWFDQLAKRAGVEMPITQAAYQVLYEGRDVHDVLTDLMSRAKRSEIEESWS